MSYGWNTYTITNISDGKKEKSREMTEKINYAANDDKTLCPISLISFSGHRGVIFLSKYTATF